MAEQTYIIKESESGSVYISEDVLATIVYESIKETEGVGGFATTFGSEIAERLGKVKKATSKNVKVHIENNQATIGVFIFVQYGFAINDVAANVQKEAANAISAMTGLIVNTINVTVSGIVFDKTK